MAESWIGRSIPRVGGVERVTGAQRYVADIRLENVLHVKLVHLNCARARVDRLDVSEAAKVAGVRCVLTPGDLPHPMPRYGPAYKDRPVLAVGEAVLRRAGCAIAETGDTARPGGAAWGRVRRVAGGGTVEQALDPAAPLVQDPAIRVEKDLSHTNVLQEWRFGWGDVGVGADCVIENDYTFPMVTHFAIEPHAFLAAPDAEGVTIWSAIQHPYVLQRVVASALGWPVAKVRIISPDPGGGFGGKGWPKFEPLLAFLALRTGRPVRLVLTLEETFQQVRRASARTHVRTGFDKAGSIVFQDIQADFLIGAYADVGGRVVSKASYAACGPYRTPNARVTARALLSHTTPSTAFRGFGTPQASWAVESQLNAAASALGMDRLEIRRRNVAKRGEAFIPGDTPADGDWEGVLNKAGNAIGWTDPLAAGRGRGVSLGLKSSSTASSSYAIARVHYDGSASILSGTSDMGQGARTVLKQIAAEELGIDPDRIAIVMGDTSVVPFDSSTSASRSTVFMGNAVAKACRDVKAKLKQMAVQTFAVPDSDVRVGKGSVVISGRELSYEEFLHAHFGPPRGEVIGIGHEGNAYDPAHPLGGRPAFWEMMCAAAEVEVDPEVGMVRIVKLILVSDIGKALNPQQVQGQDEGAAVMGLGHSFMEQLLLDDHGRIRNLGALDYRIPTIQDTAESLHSILIENEDGPGPFGAKGAGEGGILAIAAAVGAAVNEAAGIQLRDLPMTPERV